jgi:hypothetical protein
VIKDSYAELRFISKKCTSPLDSVPSETGGFQSPPQNSLDSASCFTDSAKPNALSACPTPPPWQVVSTSLTKGNSRMNSATHGVPPLKRYIGPPTSLNQAPNEVHPEGKRPLCSQEEPRTGIADFLITSFMTASIGQLPNKFSLIGSGPLWSQTTEQFATGLRIQNSRLERTGPRAERNFKELYFAPVPAVGGGYRRTYAQYYKPLSSARRQTNPSATKTGYSSHI